MTTETARQQRIRDMIKALKGSKDPDKNKLIMLCCKDWGISLRTAKEYLAQAEFNIQNEV